MRIIYRQLHIMHAHMESKISETNGRQIKEQTIKAKKLTHSMWVRVVASTEKQRRPYTRILFLVQFNPFGRQFSASDIVIIIGPLLKPSPHRCSFFSLQINNLFSRL